MQRIRLKPSSTKARRQAQGLCALCGKVPARDGMRDCQGCADKRSARDKELIQARYEKGLCHCANKCVPGYSCCQGCLDRQRKQTEHKQKNNICRSCPEPAQANRTRCAKHLLDMQIRNLDVLPEEKVRARTAAESFDGVCQNPGCGATNPGGETFGWSLDHCHDTKVFRGILCMHCNSLLGYGRDNPEILAGAIEYLKRFQPCG